MHRWPSLLALLGLFALVACSSKSNGGPGLPSAVEASTDAPGDSGAGASDGSWESGTVADAREEDATEDEEASSVPPEGGVMGEGSCAACTAQQCLTQLQGCGGSQACLAALQTFNSCFGASPDAGASCGATFAASGPEASTLWQCMSTTCASSCG